MKLLYDIYHMQIMEGDVIRTIRDNAQWIGHFHTGGVPGRHEIDDTQELNYRGIAEGGYWPNYVDPYPFLEQFVKGSPYNCTGWTSREFDSALAEANATSDHSARLERLARARTG